MIDRQSFYIRGVVEVSPPFNLNEARIVLSDALEATSTVINRVTSPAGLFELTEVA
jgi:hypothetical protein